MDVKWWTANTSTACGCINVIAAIFTTNKAARQVAWAHDYGAACDTHSTLQVRSNEGLGLVFFVRLSRKQPTPSKPHFSPTSTSFFHLISGEHTHSRQHASPTTHTMIILSMVEMKPLQDSTWALLCQKPSTFNGLICPPMVWSLGPTNEIPSA